MMVGVIMLINGIEGRNVMSILLGSLALMAVTVRVRRILRHHNTAEAAREAKAAAGLRQCPHCEVDFDPATAPRKPIKGNWTAVGGTKRAARDRHREDTQSIIPVISLPAA